LKRFFNFHNNLSFRLIFWVGLIILGSISVWAYFNIRHQKRKAIENIVSEADRLGNTIKLGAHYAMMLNSRDDINQIIKNIGRQKKIESIRIYNKEGRIKFSNKPKEIDQETNIKAEACHACHGSEPPMETAGLQERTRIFDSFSAYRLLGIISPIYNEPGCSTDPCHVHPEDKKVLGLLDVVVSLKETDIAILNYEKGIIGLAIFIVLGASGIIGFFRMRFVNRPIKKLIKGTRHIGSGEYDYKVDIDRDDKIGELALAINQMREEMKEKQEELNKQKEEYQNLFEGAPCYITVQDRDFKLLKYNREFAEQFDPQPGDYCYHAYKGRSERCEICPVIETFEDGEPHFSEETGVKKDGAESPHWLVRTSPIKNAKGEVVAAMEMSLDVTHTKFLEKEVKKSEEKYQIIFDTIPNPVFVIDRKTLDILDCNESVRGVYGYDKGEMLMASFVNLFEENERDHFASEIRSRNILNQVRQLRKDGNIIYVNMHISFSEYLGKEVLLITTSDITMRLMAEQQLIQASKMTTLGEMATGMAHELNQPLSVIKTASSFLKRKVKRGEAIKDEILETLAEEIDSYVDRASKIINHMREFGRKSDVRKEKVHVNEALNRALEIFSQQLRLREIDVIKDLKEDLPPILADANRLEQVFINLLINARDAIEEKWAQADNRDQDKKISLKTGFGGGMVIIEIKDTGIGIPRALQDKIFEPFFTTKKQGKGTGLGLSISYGIVQDYDGVIKVETEQNKWTSFIIEFPVPEKA